MGYLEIKGVNLGSTRNVHKKIGCRVFSRFPSLLERGALGSLGEIVICILQSIEVMIVMLDSFLMNLKAKR